MASRQYEKTIEICQCHYANMLCVSHDASRRVSLECFHVDNVGGQSSAERDREPPFNLTSLGPHFRRLFLAPPTSTHPFPLGTKISHSRASYMYHHHNHMPRARI
jgi:hypothetical protein